MELTFRWYGESDPVTLEHIRQIPCMRGIVTAVYDIPVGEVWPTERIADLKEQIKHSGMTFKVVESVPVHEDIKLGTGGCDKYTENYCENIRRLGAEGVEVVCYNFMPVFDWLRSDLERSLPDGSHSLAYVNEDVLLMDPVKSELKLPGWDESYTKEELGRLMSSYRDVDEEILWKNFARFINKVVPVCEEAGVKMAIHPDDPPWGIFGLPRIIKNRESYRRMAEINGSPCNGITFCTGSLGADPANDLPALAREFGSRIHFAHCRNVLVSGERDFQETAHASACGSLDMRAVLKGLMDGGFDGFIRPDHGRMIWGETGKPGYGLYDRALGAAYINGLWEGLSNIE